MVTEQQFYEFFKIEPKIITNCQYYNEFKYGIEYGEDICEYVDAPEDDYECKTCYQYQNIRKWYAPITDDTIAQLLWICPVTHNQSFKINLTDFYEDVLEHVINYFKDDKFTTPKYKLIQTILKAHMREMSRW